MKALTKATEQQPHLPPLPFSHLTVLSNKIYSLSIWKGPKCLSLGYHVQTELGLSLRMLLRNLTALQKQVQITQFSTFFPQSLGQS